MLEQEQRLLPESSSKVTEEMWSGLRDNVRNSLTELCALVDLLAVLKETKYLSIFRVDPKTSETPIITFLAGKKMNEVIATIFPGVRLSVSLDSVSSADSVTKSSEPPSNSQIIYGLSTQLRRILHRQHIASWPNISSLPLPTSGPVQIPKRMRAAGALLLTMDAFLYRNPRSLGAGQAISSLPIVTASVAGFAGTAASAWMVTNSDSGATSLSQGSAGLPNQVFLGQDRHAYFTEWGFAVPATGTGLSASNTVPGMDDILETCSNLSVFERSLDLSEASECAIETIMGSGKSLLGQFLTISRHYYLRQR
ncbi:unnamed protein product [Dibothriocephalus latus]|uniref:Uncharacterized protein n=1 Tax=Dibothriocephalus latus TaxID=60516 RepID=A0A3P6UC04_DIBLA|nr:unnamed protein product [Dibothriocephalus latus]